MADDWAVRWRDGTDGVSPEWMLHQPAVRDAGRQWRRVLLVRVSLGELGEESRGICLELPGVEDQFRRICEL